MCPWPRLHHECWVYPMSTKIYRAYVELIAGLIFIAHTSIRASKVNDQTFSWWIGICLVFLRTEEKVEREFSCQGQCNYSSIKTNIHLHTRNFDENCQTRILPNFSLFEPSMIFQKVYFLMKLQIFIIPAKNQNPEIVRNILSIIFSIYKEKKTFAIDCLHSKVSYKTFHSSTSEWFSKN